MAKFNSKIAVKLTATVTLSVLALATFDYVGCLRWPRQVKPNCFCDMGFHKNLCTFYKKLAKLMQNWLQQWLYLFLPCQCGTIRNHPTFIFLSLVAKAIVANANAKNSALPVLMFIRGKIGEFLLFWIMWHFLNFLQ